MKSVLVHYVATVCTVLFTLRSQCAILLLKYRGVRPSPGAFLRHATATATMKQRSVFFFFTASSRDNNNNNKHTKTMSLSFVSKSVLTAKEGGDGYEETPIEGGEETGGSSSAYSDAKPLFEQLRANKDQEEADRDEFQKSIMRGTLALDEEDCAHLDAVAKQRQERNALIHKETASELEAFRAAQAVNRIEQGMKDDDDDDDNDERATTNDTAQQQQQQKAAAAAATRTSKSKPLFPTIIAKKRRKVPASATAKTTTGGGAPKKPKKEPPTSTTVPASAPVDSKPGLGGLLAGYGSDSDSD